LHSTPHIATLFWPRSSPHLALVGCGSGPMQHGMMGLGSGPQAGHGNATMSAKSKEINQNWTLS